MAVFIPMIINLILFAIHDTQGIKMAVYLLLRTGC